MVHIRTLMDQIIKIDEGRMKDIFTANQEGESAEEIAKRLKLPIKTVKSIFVKKSYKNSIIIMIIITFGSVQVTRLE